MFFVQVLQIRKDLFSQYRVAHGLRIKADRDGSSSIDASINARVQWTLKAWIEPMNHVASYLKNGISTLRKWQVLRLSPTGSGELETDEFLLQVVESLARTFFGLHTRSLSPWQGGIYNMCKLCSPEPLHRAEAVARGQALFPRILALEQYVAGDTPDPAVLEFESRFLWYHSVIYREILGLLSEGDIAMATLLAWRAHSSVYHEKGLSTVGTKYGDNYCVAHEVRGMGCSVCCLSHDTYWHELTAPCFIAFSGCCVSCHVWFCQ